MGAGGVRLTLSSILPRRRLRLGEDIGREEKTAVDPYQEGPAHVQRSRQASQGRWLGSPTVSAPGTQSLLPEGKAQVLCALCSPPPRGSLIHTPFTQESVNKHRQSASPRPRCVWQALF